MSTLTAYGSSIKTLEDTGDRLRIGGYLVLFGSPEEHDATVQRDYFSKSTDFDIPSSGALSTVYYHHGLNPTLKSRPLGKARLELRDAGVWMEAELQARDEYEAKIQELVRLGKLGLSSGTASHLVQRTERKNAFGETVHHIDRWPLGLDASLTPTPGEPRTAALCLKALEELADVRDEVSSAAGEWDYLFEYVCREAAFSGVYYLGGDVAAWGMKSEIWDESRHPRDERGRWTAGFVTASRTSFESMQQSEKSLLSREQVDTLMPASVHRFRPQGTPVVKGIDFRGDSKQLNAAFDAIQSVHGDGKLPFTAFYLLDTVTDNDGDEVNGLFTPHSSRGGSDIRISTKARSPLLTAIHETAHFLDFHGLFKSKPRSGFATEVLNFQRATEHQPKEWQEFHRAVVESEVWQKLAGISRAAAECIAVNPTGEGARRQQRITAYLMKPQEVFARAYTQYVALRCSDPDVGLHLRQYLAVQVHPSADSTFSGTVWDGIHFPYQWTAEDFEPIARALDQLFLEHGWLVPKPGVKTMNQDELTQQEPSPEDEERLKKEAWEAMLRFRDYIESGQDGRLTHFMDAISDPQTPEQWEWARKETERAEREAEEQTRRMQERQRLSGGEE